MVYVILPLFLQIIHFAGKSKMIKQQLLKYSRNLVVTATLAGTVFSADSNSFARTRPPLSLKPEAVVSYVDFNARVAGPLNPSTDRVFIKILNLSNKAV